jgi:predicted metal-dependent hydrolase
MNLNGLEIEIKRSNRTKTLSINIERGGSVNVIVPVDLEESKIMDILKSKEYEIHKQITNNRELNKERIDRKFVPGHSFLYLGKSYNLQIEENQIEPLILYNGKFLLSSKSIVKAENVFIKFYKKQGQPILEKRISYFKEFIKEKPKEIKIVDLKTRWASCTPLGNLNFHWKCFMAPLSVLDYLIVHELVHLKHLNHSRQFWDEVSIILPDYKEHINWLNKNGVKMTLSNNIY